MRLSKAIEAYGEALTGRALSAHTRKAFGNDVKLFGHYMAGLPTDLAPVHAGGVTTAHVRQWLAALATDGEHAPKSIERRLTSVKVFFRWLREKKYIGHDPAEVVAYEHLVDPLPTYLTEAEVARVLIAARTWAEGEKLDQRPLTAIMVVLETGMKKNECVRLHAGDVAPNEIRIRYPKRHMKFKERRLGMGADCAVQIAAHIARYACPNGRLFECTDRNLEYLIARHIAPAAGLKRLTFEMLRWTCAVRMWGKGEAFAGQMQMQFGLSDQGWVEMRAKLERMGEGVAS